jgi:hypothetical protein
MLYVHWRSKWKFVHNDLNQKWQENKVLNLHLTAEEHKDLLAARNNSDEELQMQLDGQLDEASSCPSKR